MKSSVYIETSVVSYFVAESSSDIRIAGHQLATKECWARLLKYRVFVSDTVVEEASRGNADQSQKRLQAIKLFEVLEISEKVQNLASNLLASKAIPDKCPEDALHIACAAVNNIEIVVTWNFKHINNPFMLNKIRQVVVDSGWKMPVICSPDEFLEAENE